MKIKRAERSFVGVSKDTYIVLEIERGGKITRPDSLVSLQLICVFYGNKK